MIFKIHTSKRTMEIFAEIGTSERLQPFALSKLAIAISVHKGGDLQETDLHTDPNGLELNRQTITGEYDDLFKGIIEMHEKRHLTDDEYLQTYLKAHLDRGARMLYSEFKYGGDFMLQLLDLDGGI